MTNTLTGVSIQATKEWKGDDSVKGETRPTNITLKLWRKTDTSDWMLVPFSEADTASNSNNVNTVTLRIETTGNGQVTHTWSGLPAYTTTASGARVKYLYKVTEEPIAGYTTGITDANGFDLTNSLASGLKQCTVTNTLNPISIPATKTWIDDANWAADRPDFITLTLQRKVGESGSWADYGDPIRINRQSGDTWSDATGFTNLPRYVNLGGALTPCFYQVSEAAGDVPAGC